MTLITTTATIISYDLACWGCHFQTKLILAVITFIFNAISCSNM